MLTGVTPDILIHNSEKFTSLEHRMFDDTYIDHRFYASGEPTYTHWSHYPWITGNATINYKINGWGYLGSFQGGVIRFDGEDGFKFRGPDW